jgi:hypothetical protein
MAARADTRKIFWAHNLDALAEWVEETRPYRAPPCAGFEDAIEFALAA